MLLGNVPLKKRRKESKMSDFEDEEGVDEPVLDDENDEEGQDEEEVSFFEIINCHFWLIVCRICLLSV